MHAVIVRLLIEVPVLFTLSGIASLWLAKSVSFAPALPTPTDWKHEVAPIPTDEELSAKRVTSIRYLDYLIDRICHDVHTGKSYLQIFREMDELPIADFVGNVDMDYMGTFLDQSKIEYKIQEEAFFQASTEEEAKRGINNFLQIITGLRDYLQYKVAA